MSPLPCCRKKLLVVAGAGASVQFGMPSVAEVHSLLLTSAAQCFPLADDLNQNLYGFLHDRIRTYWSSCVGPRPGREPNFEDILYAISALSSSYPAGILTGVLGALVRSEDLPEILHFHRDKREVDFNILRHIEEHLIDELISEFRQRCGSPALNVNELAVFFKALDQEFEIAVVTTNYDDLIYRCLQGIETGFDPETGLFNQGRIISRRSWPCFLHLHGSVHFDMDIIDQDLHAIKWQNDLGKEFHQNSFGRSPVSTAEGIGFPTSAIIAGYGKSMQIQRLPFRTYFLS
jgi:hypothetical protein